MRRRNVSNISILQQLFILNNVTAPLTFDRSLSESAGGVTGLGVGGWASGGDMYVSQLLDPSHLHSNPNTNPMYCHTLYYHHCVNTEKYTFLHT